mmetsp:Transcript_21410/g.27357  ORF Transcript_21410/g.27357 Transcript_21410/m.27357 type:complete len:81 (+) Transcript_21410:241-483(+)
MLLVPIVKFGYVMDTVGEIKHLIGLSMCTTKCRLDLPSTMSCLEESNLNIVACHLLTDAATTARAPLVVAAFLPRVNAPT